MSRPAAPAIFAASLAIVVIGYALSSGPHPLVWLAERDGVQALSASGHAIVKISCASAGRALAVDAQSESVWAFCDGTDLRSYTIAGDLRTSLRLDNVPARPALLAIDTQAGRIWLASGPTAWLLDTQGALLRTLHLDADVVALTLDRRQSRAWLATSRSLTVHRADGAAVLAVDVAAIAPLRALDYDLEQDQAWVAGENELARYHADGTLALRDGSARVRGMEFVAADGYGGVWVASARQLAHVGAGGVVSCALTPFASDATERIVSLAAVSADRTVWVASDRQLAHYHPNGMQRTRFVPAARGGLLGVALPIPAIPPELRMFAAAGPVTAFPVLRLSYRGADVKLDTLAFTANGQRMPAVCDSRAGTITCVPRRALAHGRYDIGATVAGRSGLVSDPAIIQVDVEAGVSTRSRLR